jgi:hypothetical protein
MCNARPGNSAGDLSNGVRRTILPAESASYCVSQTDNGIKVCSGDRLASANQCNQCRAGRNRVREQSDRHVSTSQTFAHDSRAYNRSHKKRRPDELRCQPHRQGEFHWRPMLAISR